MEKGPKGGKYILSRLNEMGESIPSPKKKREQDHLVRSVVKGGEMCEQNGSQIRCYLDSQDVLSERCCQTEKPQNTGRGVLKVSLWSHNTF